MGRAWKVSKKKRREGWEGGKSAWKSEKCSEKCSDKCAARKAASFGPKYKSLDFIICSCTEYGHTHSHTALGTLGDLFLATRSSRLSIKSIMKTARGPARYKPQSMITKKCTLYGTRGSQLTAHSHTMPVVATCDFLYIACAGPDRCPKVFEAMAELGACQHITTQGHHHLVLGWPCCFSSGSGLAPPP